MELGGKVAKVRSVCRQPPPTHGQTPALAHHKIHSLYFFMSSAATATVMNKQSAAIRHLSLSLERCLSALCSLFSLSTLERQRDWCVQLYRMYDDFHLQYIRPYSYVYMVRSFHFISTPLPLKTISPPPETEQKVRILRWYKHTGLLTQ